MVSKLLENSVRAGHGVRFRRPRWRHCTAVAALCLTPVFASAASPPASVIRVAIASDLRSTTPGVNRDNVTDWTMIHIVETLLAFDGNLRPAPMLAQSWTMSEDGREYSFRLRPNVKFHNGETMRAEHVVWSWQRLLQPDTRWPCRPWFDGTGGTGIRIASIEAPDPLTVRFRLDEPNALFLYRVADLQCQAAIVHPASVDARGRWQRPIGTGPYRFSEWQRGRYVQLDRFEDYSYASGPASGLAGRKEAIVPTIRMVVIPDASAAKLAALSGEIDVWPLTAAEALPELRRGRHLRLVEESSRDWAVLLMKHQHGVLRNPAMRAAIASVLDPGLIMESTMYIKHPPRPYAVPAGEIDPEIIARVPPAYQPERTRELLQQAGYRGEPLEIDVSRELSYFNDAIVMHALLTRAGINARVRSMDWATQIKRYWSGEYELSIFAYTGRPAPPMMYSVFVCETALRANCIVETPKALDILASMSHAEPAAWPSLVGELELEIARDRSIVGLYAPPRITTLNGRVEGYQTWALGLPRLWGVSLAASR